MPIIRLPPPMTTSGACKMDTAIQKAEKRVMFVRGDQEELRAYQMRELAEAGWVNGVNHARREGRQERDWEIAKKALSKGLPIETIHELTGLTDNKSVDYRRNG